METFTILLPEHVESGNLGLKLSGGVDSSLLLFLMAKEISDNGYNCSIFPTTGYKTDTGYNNKKEVDHIIQTVRGMFPNVTIHNSHELLFSMEIVMSTYDTKFDYSENMIPTWIDVNNIKYLFHGMTMNPPVESLVEGGIQERSANGSKLIYAEVWNNKTLIKPFFDKDKSFVAELYKEHDLLETIFPYTVSCIESNDDEPQPCKMCFWCQEKFWAFNSYDQMSGLMLP